MLLVLYSHITSNRLSADVTGEQRLSAVCLFVLKWCDPADITPTLSTYGARSIICGGYRMRLARTCAKGALAWRCSVLNSCPGRVHTDQDVTRIIKFIGEHNHCPKDKKPSISKPVVVIETKPLDDDEAAGGGDGDSHGTPETKRILSIVTC